MTDSGERMEASDSARAAPGERNLVELDGRVRRSLANDLFEVELKVWEDAD